MRRYSFLKKNCYYVQVEVDSNLDLVACRGGGTKIQCKNKKLWDGDDPGVAFNSYLTNAFWFHQSPHVRAKH